MYMKILLSCISVRHVCAWFPRMLEEDIISCGIRYRCWESNPGTSGGAASERGGGGEGSFDC